MTIQLATQNQWSNLTLKCYVNTFAIPYLYHDIYETSKILSFILFADDTNLFHSDKKLNSLLNTTKKELNEITMHVALKINSL